MIEDVYSLQLAAGREMPVLATISAGWFDPYGRNVVSQVDPQGNESSFIGKVKVAPERWPADPQTRIASFGAQVALARADIKAGNAQAVQLDLAWVSQVRPLQDYTVFVHILDEQGRLFAQHDQPPLSGGYPTSAWEAGEVIRDRVVVPLPIGPDAPRASQVRLGLYDPVTGERLPAFDESGQVIGDSLILPLTTP